MALAAQVLADTRVLTKEKWLSIRKGGLGGSDSAACAGLNPWKSPLALYLEKRGELPDVEENEAMSWGVRLEPIVAAQFAEESGLKVRRRNAILQHPDHPWMLANVDRLIVGADEGLEVKTTSEYNRDQWEGDDVPPQYILQCAHYMAVTGYQAWWIAVLIGGNKFRYKRIERDEALISDLTSIENDFWQRVQTGNPPPPDGSESSSKLMAERYPRSVAQTITLPPSAAYLITQYQESAAAEKSAEKAKEEAANQLKALLGENEQGEIDGYKVTWKSVTSERLDTKALKTELPDIAERFLKASESRRFTIKEAK